MRINGLKTMADVSVDTLPESIDYTVACGNCGEATEDGHCPFCGWPDAAVEATAVPYAYDVARGRERGEEVPDFRVPG